MATDEVYGAVGLAMQQQNWNVVPHQHAFHGWNVHNASDDPGSKRYVVMVCPCGETKFVPFPE